MDKKNQTFLNTKLLLIVCAVLLLAVIVLGAFAYQWHGENKDLKQYKKGQILIGANIVPKKQKEKYLKQIKAKNLQNILF